MYTLKKYLSKPILNKYLFKSVSILSMDYNTLATESM